LSNFIDLKFHQLSIHQLTKLSIDEYQSHHRL